VEEKAQNREEWAFVMKEAKVLKGLRTVVPRGKQARGLRVSPPPPAKLHLFGLPLLID
jgi:hypothetical protein